MAKTTGQSAALALFKKQTKGAVQKSRDVAPRPSGFVNMPGNLNGIGRLIKAELTTTKDQGKGVSAMVAFRFIVREPIDYNGVQQNKNYVMKARTEGKNPKSIQDIVDELYNDLQLLNIQTAGTDDDDLPRLLEELSEAKPYFRFSTWEWHNPDTKAAMYGHNIIGIAQGFVPSEPEPEIEPEPEAEAAPEPEPEPEPAKPKGPKPVGGIPAKPKGPKPVEIEPEPEPEPEADEPGTEQESDWVPKVGDHYYCTLGGGHSVVVVTEVDLDAKLVKVTEKESGKKWTKIAFVKLEGE